MSDPSAPRREAQVQNESPPRRSDGRHPGVDPPGPTRAVVAVVVTFERAALLRRCLASLHAQRRAPDAVVVVDDASPGPDTAAAVAAFPGVRHLRHTANSGGAAAYRTGIEAALAMGADLVWLMDDDGRPADGGCLERLIAAAEQGAGISAPLVLDHEDPARLAFPIRLGGRTRFLVEDLGGAARVEGFAHLFNGALIRAGVFAALGLPDPRFVCRGDEAEFLLRALRAGVAVRTDTGARFLHPSSRPEVHPILFGASYATVPLTEAKRRLQFRNRGHIFRAYGMWTYLAADVARYGWHFLLRRRPDLPGFGRWLAATAAGWGGRFMREPPPERGHVVVTPGSPRGVVAAAPSGYPDGMPHAPPAMQDPAPPARDAPPPTGPAAADEVTRRVLERSLGSVDRILRCADPEITSRAFLLERIKEFGIPYNEWPEMWQFLSWRNPTDFGLMQVPTEFADYLLALVRQRTIRTALEVGVWHGASSYLTCAVLQRLNPDAEYHMVDVEDRTLGFDRFRERLNLVKHIPSTSSDFEGEAFDLVFIDGDHSYGGVNRDYLCVGRHARQVVAFHDVRGREFDGLGGGPARFWTEFRATHSDRMTVCELMHSQTAWMGIGMGIRAG